MGGDGNDAFTKTDWRLGSSIVFYITYALLGASLSAIEVGFQDYIFNQSLNSKK